MILILLLAAHFLCDYPLQGDFLAQGKGSFSKPHFGIPWWHCMAAHCAIHAGAVAIITGSVYLAAGEFALHFIIDVLKCKKVTGINFDQAAHVVCKIAWAAVAAGVLA